VAQFGAPSSGLWLKFAALAEPSLAQIRRQIRRLLSLNLLKTAP